MGLLYDNEQILLKWEKICQIREPNRQFVRDGLLYRGDIICSDGKWERCPSNKEDSLWQEAPLKILFLMKDYTNDSMPDIRYETFRKNQVPKGKNPLKKDSFTMNILYWLYGLTHINKDSIVPFSDIKDGQKCFRFYERYPMARINCKKVAGESTIKDAVLYQYISDVDYSTLLKEQILLFKANIIVCCGGGGIIARFVKDICYFEDLWECKDSLWYNIDNDVLVIDAYHPSCRISRRDLYENISDNYLRFVTCNPSFCQKIEKMYSFEKDVMEELLFNISEPGI